MIPVVYQYLNFMRKMHKNRYSESYSSETTLTILIKLCQKVALWIEFPTVYSSYGHMTFCEETRIDFKLCIEHDYQKFGRLLFTFLSWMRALLSVSFSYEADILYVEAKNHSFWATIVCFRLNVNYSVFQAQIRLWNYSSNSSNIKTDPIRWRCQIKRTIMLSCKSSQSLHRLVTATIFNASLSFWALVH